MARYPIIDSPCPYVANLSAIMDGSLCRMCKREVHDLTAFSDAQRDAFFAACKGEVCVKFERPARGRVFAAALTAAALAMPMAVAAQDAEDAPEIALPVAGATEAGIDASLEDVIVVAGGIKAPDAVRYEEEKADAALAVLPSAYEDEADGETGATPDQPTR